MAGCDAEFVEEEGVMCSNAADGEFDRRILEGVDFWFIILLVLIFVPVPGFWFLGQCWGVADLELWLRCQTVVLRRGKQRGGQRQHTGMPLIFTILTELSRNVREEEPFAAENLSRTSFGRLAGVVMESLFEMAEGLMTADSTWRISEKKVEWGVEARGVWW